MKNPIKNPFKKTYRATVEYRKISKTIKQMTHNLDELPQEAKDWILRDLLHEKGIFL